MRALESAPKETRHVKWGEPVFTQPVALAEATILADDADIALPGMPLAKAPVTLRLAKGAQFFRVATAESDHRTLRVDRPIQLDRLPATVELGGTALIVRAIDAEGAEIAIISDHRDAPLLVALAGLILREAQQP